MYKGQLEVISYEVGLWEHNGAGQDGLFLGFGPKRSLAVNCKDPASGDKHSVWFVFGAQCL
jgi:hypothetical protein